MTRMTLNERIMAALANGPVNRIRLRTIVFPPNEHPNAHRYQTNGGPPGCVMAIGKALKRLKCKQCGNTVYPPLVYPFVPEKQEGKP